MSALVDLQRSFARAMTSGDGAAVAKELRGGADPRARLAIHVRHYAASLSTALLEKFPASTWLVGADVLRDAAHAYARLHPPQQPCIGEYGRDFPQFLARHSRAAHLPYLASFAELEWAVAHATIAVDSPPLSWNALASCGAERLVDSALALQPGLRYLRADWRIDELMRTYLGGAPPEKFVLLDDVTRIEVHGARGAFRLTRLDAGSFAFRAALAAGRTIGDAADAALTVDAELDPGDALRAMAEADLVTGSTASHGEWLR